MTSQPLMRSHHLETILALDQTPGNDCDFECKSASVSGTEVETEKIKKLLYFLRH